MAKCSWTQLGHFRRHLGLIEHPACLLNLLYYCTALPARNLEHVKIIGDERVIEGIFSGANRIKGQAYYLRQFPKSSVLSKN